MSLKEKLIQKFDITTKKKVTVADIKQYLVDEFQKTNDQQEEIEKLKDKIKKSLEIELKYNTTLVTLDEYKNRLDDRDKRISKLEKDIENLENKLRKENELKNDEILKSKKITNSYDELNKSFNKALEQRINSKEQEIRKGEYIKYKNKIENIIATIENSKGNISKAKIIEIINSK